MGPHHWGISGELIGTYTVEVDQSYSDRMVWWAFGNLNPAIADFPHCIVFPSRGNLECVLRVVKCRPGWYGGGIIPSYLYLAPELDKTIRERYPVAEDWVDYIDSWDGWRFVWSNPAMQDVLLENACWDAENFNMVINLDTPLDVLDQIGSFEPDTEDGGAPIIERSIPRLMPELRWAYIRLGEEVKHVIFVASHENAPWVKEVKEAVLASGESVAWLVKGEGRCYWHETKAP